MSALTCSSQPTPQMRSEQGQRGNQAAFLKPEGIRDCSRYQIVIAEGRQIDKRHPVGKRALTEGRGRDCETGLSDAAGTDEREQASVRVGERGLDES
jgi:hypothetical protein